MKCLVRFTTNWKETLCSNEFKLILHFDADRILFRFKKTNAGSFVCIITYNIRFYVRSISFPGVNISVRSLCSGNQTRHLLSWSFPLAAIVCDPNTQLWSSVASCNVVCVSKASVYNGEKFEDMIPLSSNAV